MGHMSIPFACIPMHSSTTMHRPEITIHMHAQSQVGRSRYSCRRAGSSGSRVAIPFGVANTGLCCGCIKWLAGVAHTFASVRIDNGDILARSRNAESGVPADGAGVGWSGFLSCSRNCICSLGWLMSAGGLPYSGRSGSSGRCTPSAHVLCGLRAIVVGRIFRV